MSIPEYQVLMLPLLELASDGKEHTVREAKEVFAARFELTDDDEYFLHLRTCWRGWLSTCWWPWATAVLAAMPEWRLDSPGMEASTG